MREVDTICSHSVGLSVRGTRHVRDATPNQDAWRSGRGPHGHVVAVCDGVGSCSSSHIGARLASRAVHEAVRASGVGLSSQDLGGRIGAAWRRRLPSGPIGHFSTTCLAAIRLRTGRLLCGGIGDGMVAVGHVRSREARIVMLDAGEFGETHALGTHDANHWHFDELDDARGGTWILLATDGLSHELDVARLPDMAHWLIAKTGPMSARKRAVYLRSQLRDVQRGPDRDDATLALLWSTPDD